MDILSNFNEMGLIRKPCKRIASYVTTWHISQLNTIKKQQGIKIQHYLKANIKPLY